MFFFSFSSTVEFAPISELFLTGFSERTSKKMGLVTPNCCQLDSFSLNSRKMALLFTGFSERIRRAEVLKGTIETAKYHVFAFD